VTDRRVKLLTIGDGLAGKTTILKSLQANFSLSLGGRFARFLGSTASFIPQQDRTEKVMVYEWNDKSNNINWIIFDLPGQSQYYSTNILFLSEENSIQLVVVRLDQKESMQDQLFRWLSTINARQHTKEVQINLSSPYL